MNENELIEELRDLFTASYCQDGRFSEPNTAKPPPVVHCVKL